MSKIVEPSGYKALGNRVDALAASQLFSSQTLLQWLIGVVCRHHNKIQFFGYEAANILLVWQRTGDAGSSQRGFTYEALAALAFMLGSACICLHDPDRRPAGLFFGSLGLIAGGILLIIAGYPLTGFAVTIASLETARGGLFALEAELARSTRPDRSLTKLTLILGQRVLGFYVLPVNLLCRRFGKLGGFLNDRPFLSSAIIKLPLRLEFVIKNLLLGDAVGVIVGLSWMILGDGALAFNDERLRQAALQMSGPSTTATVSLSAWRQ